VRNKRLVGAAQAAPPAAGCRREPAAPAADNVTLAAPAPSSTVVTSPLGVDSSSYTNEMQAQNLRDQAAELGISRLAKPSTESGDESDEPHRTITYQEGLERTREMTREAATERRAISGDANKSVAIPTQTPGVLAGDKAGSPIENAPQNQ
jgi:hypothetical protein